MLPLSMSPLKTAPPYNKRSRYYELNDIIQIAEKEFNNQEHCLLINLGIIVHQYEIWINRLPNVVPYYAIKSNPDIQIINILKNLGCHFDIASKKELQKVIECGVTSDKIIYANPCKPESHIKYSCDNGVNMMVIDSLSEMEKIHRICPNVKIIIRIKVDDSHSLCKFNIKFGLDVEELNDIFDYAHKLNILIYGVSFHVGSSCKNKNVFRTAIYECKYVIDLGRLYGFDMNIVDIGGGFPGDIDSNLFDDFADTINTAISDYFGKEEYNNIRFIAEPGRYFVMASHTLFSTVINKKVKMKQNENGLIEKTHIYYILDGIYGVFSGMMFDYAEIDIKVLHKNEKKYDDNEKQLYNTIIFGPTCDSLDIICKNKKIPEIDIGDKIVVPNIGAYSVASAVEFNGFPIPEKIYIF